MLREKRCKQCLCTHKREKTSEPLLRIGCIFLLVEAPAPTPGERKVFWVTIPSESAARLKIALESGCIRKKFISKTERVEMS